MHPFTALLIIEYVKHSQVKNVLTSFSIIFLLYYFKSNYRNRSFYVNTVSSNEMFVRMLTVHFDQNNSYEININGVQVRKINEIRNVIFGLRYGNPSSALRPKLGCSPS